MKTTTTNPKSHIGTVLKQDHSGAASCIAVYESKIIPAVEKVIAGYQELEMGPFTQSVLDDLLANSTTNLEKKVEQAIRNSLSKLHASVTELALQNAREKLDVLAVDLRAVHRILHEERSFVGVSKAMDLRYITIQDEKVVLDEKALRALFEIRIKTEAQSQLYDHLQNVQNAWNDLVAFAQAKNIRGVNIYGPLHLFSRDEEGRIHFKPESMMNV